MKTHFQTLFLLISLLLIGCETNSVDYHSKLEIDSGDYIYALYLDGVGIGDPGYTVVKLEKNINPEEVYIKWTPREGINYEENKEQIEWFRERIILENYDEAGFHTQNPKIEYINNRYIVFSRGGYYYGLYDIFLKKDTFNIGSPWHEWREKSGYKSEKYDRNKEKKLYDEWIKNNIHAEIKNYILTNK
ncbi:hypothetical protein SDC9_42969 [bioreactor metagenome]|uniref:Lipoprotein n=1 Tax=bioreactor metagenome TaxID=1076179 RepID=A0A644VZW0_9ZZZZ|nr:hypothetical protein [Paludibacter sp.]